MRILETIVLLLLASVCGCGTVSPTDASVPADSGMRDTGAHDAADAFILVDGSDGAMAPDAPVSDAGPDASDAGDLSDASSCPLPPSGAVGGACATDSECDSAAGVGDGFCLRGRMGATVWPDAGYCINRVATCTMDADCGSGNVCATVDDPGGAFSACVAGCGTGCVCGDGQLCQGSFSGLPLLGGDVACVPGDASATDGAPCTSFGDCAAESVCIEDALEHPGGQCHRAWCTIGDDATCADGGDGHCIDQRSITAGVATANVCVDACTVDDDCRVAEGYRCFDGGATVGRFCRHPQAGDACAVDADCGPADAWDCKIGVTFPGGMCTPTTGCPTPGLDTGCTAGSSVCYDSVLPAVPTDNVCVDRCGGPFGTEGGCRTGYTCRDTHPGALVVLGCVNP